MPNNYDHIHPSIRKSIERAEKAILQSGGFKEVKEIEKEILAKVEASPQDKQQEFSFIPNQMAKTSIFFPISKKDQSLEHRLISKIEQVTPWGQFTITGVKLSILDEDVLLALISLIKTDPFKPSDNGYLLETNMKKILHILYGREGYSQKNESVILGSLQRFSLIGFELKIGEWRKKGKERLKAERILYIGGILNDYHYKGIENQKKLKIYFNSSFIKYLLQSQITYMDINIRRKLKKEGSKALYRFLSTHTQPNSMHLLTVLSAINWNTKQPLYTLRKQLKNILKELRDHKLIGTKTYLNSHDMVHFEPTQAPQKS